jgi:4-hydroxy-tetrahydrodipicolinate synthase
MHRTEIVSDVDKLRERLDGGLVAATPVPFDGAGRFHARAHEAYTAYMAGQPVAGVAVWAHTGRGLMLDASTAERVLRDWRDVLPDRLVIAGVGAPAAVGAEPGRATARSIRMAEDAARLGADALLVYAPSWLRGREGADALVVEHHRRVAEVGLPLVLFYLYEGAGGIGYAPAVLDELLAMPEVVGIKMATLDSVMTYQDIARRIRERHPEKLLVTGEDRFLGYSLMCGARSALVGMGAVCCGLQANLIGAHCAGDVERFMRLSAAVDALGEALFVRPMEGYIGRVLWALAHQRVIPAEAAHDPWGPELSAGELRRVEQTLGELGLTG